MYPYILPVLSFKRSLCPGKAVRQTAYEAAVILRRAFPVRHGLRHHHGGTACLIIPHSSPADKTPVPDSLLLFTCSTGRRNIPPLPVLQGMRSTFSDIRHNATLRGRNTDRMKKFFRYGDSFEVSWIQRPAQFTVTPFPS